MPDNTPATAGVITLVAADNDHPVPGIDVEFAAQLACLRNPVIQAWITGQRAAAGPGGRVVIADPGSVSHGGRRSRVVRIDDTGEIALAELRTRLQLAHLLR